MYFLLMYDMDGYHFRIPLSFVIVFLGVGFGGHQVPPFPFQQLHSMPKKRPYIGLISRIHIQENVTFIGGSLLLLTNPDLK